MNFPYVIEPLNISHDRESFDCGELSLNDFLKRFARQTLCFSRSCVLHDLVSGLYMNHIEFGCAV